MTQQGNVTLKIPRPIHERLQQVIEGSGFQSATEFVTYVLWNLLSFPTNTNKDKLGDRQLKIIREQLREAGYL
jgi:hypothetical protein